MSTTLTDADFRTDGATLISSYALPAIVTGEGQIDRKSLSAALIDVTKPYDGTSDATLTNSNFVFEGFVDGEGVTSGQTQGQFAGSTVGSHTVSATLNPTDLIANVGTLLGNYALPTRAEGPGVIAPTTMDIASIAARALGGSHNPTEAEKQTGLRLSFVVANPRIYIPYPAPDALATWRTNGFGSLPNIMIAIQANADTQEAGGELPIINSTEQILLQGDKSKKWRIEFTPPPPSSAPASMHLGQLGQIEVNP